MRNKRDKRELSSSDRDRREFISRFGKASLGLPASALLVSVAGKRARANGSGYDDEGWEGNHEQPSAYIGSYSTESGDDWSGPKPRGTTVMRSYDRGGVSEIMTSEPGGKGDAR